MEKITLEIFILEKFLWTFLQGAEIDLISTGDEHKKENGNVLNKILQWIEQIKLVFIAFGIF